MMQIGRKNYRGFNKPLYIHDNPEEHPEPVYTDRKDDYMSEQNMSPSIESTMPTVPQAKSIAVRTVGVNASDRYAYKYNWDSRQMVVDVANLSVGEYFTVEKVDRAIKDFVPDNDMRDLIARVAVSFAQDMIAQRAVKSRPRKPAESLIGFSVAEVAERVTKGML